ncbi:mitochondrial carrier domain-containing protein [Pelagophyceae sp. CCMP2097]|nr:mitochondrial carrier domain-containing protein [Pelagophyceae sp. CCMP2097]
MNPLDTLKVRYQVATTQEPLGAFARQLVRSEGLVAGLWAPGLAANALGIGISSMGRVGIYPFIRDAAAGRNADGSKATASPALMFCAGLFSGAVGYMACAPVYQVKTLAQAEAGTICPTTGKLTSGARSGLVPLYHGHSLWASLGALQAEGALFRGAGALVIRGAMLSAGQQLGYDGAKTLMRARDVAEGPVMHAAASIAGAFGACVFSTPADVLMTRYQAAASMGVKYDGIGSCAVAIWKTDGALGFYRGFWPFVARLCPVFLLSLPLTEQLRKLFGLGYA